MQLEQIRKSIGSIDKGSINYCSDNVEIRFESLDIAKHLTTYNNNNRSLHVYVKSESKEYEQNQQALESRLNG
jgi:hypothetical protein